MGVVDSVWRRYLARIQEAQRVRTPHLPQSAHIYLSEATGCERKATLRLLRYPAAEHSYQSQLNIRGGLTGEEKVAVVLEAEGCTVVRQVGVQTEYGNGKIDLLVYAPSSTHEEDGVIVEVKTSTVDKAPWLPRREHVDQVLLYQAFYQSVRLTPDVRTWQVLPAELVYLLRTLDADGQVVEGGDKLQTYPVAWDAERFLGLEARLRAIRDGVQAGEPLPIPPTYTPGSPPCAFPHTGRCVYWAHCWGTARMGGPDRTPEAMPSVPGVGEHATPPPPSYADVATVVL